LYIYIVNNKNLKNKKINMNKEDVEVGKNVTVEMGRTSRLNGVEFTVIAKGDYSVQLAVDEERYAIEYHKLRPIE